MNAIEFKAQNIKCMGCVNAIKDGLKGAHGIETVEVDLENKQVSITGNDLSRELIAEKMTTLGYPLT